MRAGNLRLVHAISASSVKRRSAPFRHCRDGRIYSYGYVNDECAARARTTHRCDCGSIGSVGLKVRKAHEIDDTPRPAFFMFWVILKMRQGETREVARRIMIDPPVLKTLQSRCDTPRVKHRNRTIPVKTLYQVFGVLLQNQTVFI